MREVQKILLSIRPRLRFYSDEVRWNDYVYILHIAFEKKLRHREISEWVDAFSLYIIASFYSFAFYLIVLYLSLLMW